MTPSACARPADRRAPSRVQRRGPPSSDEWTVVAMSGQHYPVLWIGRTAVVSLPTEIDITNADQVREDLLSTRSGLPKRRCER